MKPLNNTALILWTLVPLIMGGAAGNCQGENLRELLENQQKRNGYYLEEQQQAWEIKNDGKESVLAWRTSFRITGRQGWKRILPVMIHYGWNAKVRSVEIEVREGSEKPKKYKKSEMMDFPAYLGFELYSDRRVLVFDKAFTAEEGSLNLYFEIEETLPVLSRSFPVQSEVPVKRSSLSVKAPAGWTIREAWLNCEPEQGAGPASNVFTWSGVDIPPVLEEAYSPPLTELARQVAVACLPPEKSPQVLSFAHWDEVAGWYRSLFTPQLALTPGIRKQADSLALQAGSRLEIIRALYDFSRQQVRYVAVEIGQGNFQPHAVKLTFEKKYGDCKDKAALLCAMLASQGIAAFPVLVRTRNSGQVLPDFPSPYQFNHCIAFVPPSEYLEHLKQDDPAAQGLKDGLYLDATPELCPFGELPPEDQDTWALVIGNNGGELNRIPAEWQVANSTVRVTRVELQVDGRAKCSASERYCGTDNHLVRRRIFGVKSEERVQLWSRKLNDYFPRSRCARFEIGNEADPGLPLEIEYEFSLQKYAQSTGGLLIFPALYWKLFRENPFNDSTRINPVYLGHRRTEVDTVYIALPGGFSAESLPESARLTGPFGEFELRAETLDSRTILISRTCRFSDSEIPVSQYANLRAFIAGMIEKEKGQVVLAKL